MFMRSTLTDLYLGKLANIREVNFNNYKDWPEQFSKYFSVEGTNRSFENYTGVSGLGLMTEVDEAEDIDSDQPIQLYDKKLTPVKYGLAVEHTREAMDDDEHGIVVKQGALLSRAARQTEEILAAAIADGSHDTYTSADGSYIHVATHPLGGGGTGSNLLSAATDLSITGIEGMINLLEATTDDRGLQIQAIGKKLVVNKTDQFALETYLNSPDDPTTADRSTNPIGGYPLGGEVWYYLTDTDKWYMWSDVAMDVPGWIFLRRQPFDLGHDVNERNQTAVTVATTRFTLGVVEWRGTVASLGTS